MAQNIVGFTCSGCEEASYLNSGYFQKILNHEIEISKECLNVFGKQETNCSVFTKVKQTFTQIRKVSCAVKNIVVTNSSDNFEKASILYDAETLRKDILTVFQIIICNLQKMLPNSSMDNILCKNIMTQLVVEIKILLISIGKISSMANIGDSRYFSTSARNCHQFRHLCLDVWLNSIVILCNVYTLMPVSFDVIFCDFVDQSSPFLQLASLSMYGLSCVALEQYEAKYNYNSSPFLCACDREFWIMLIKLIDGSIYPSSFWDIYLSNIQVIIKNIMSPSSNEDIPIGVFSSNSLAMKNLMEACFWLTSHTASLYKYDTSGCFSELEVAKSGYNVVKYLICNFLKDPKIGEKSLRKILLHCIDIAKLWEPSGDLIIPLTEHYTRNVDGTFSMKEINLSYLFKDASSWFKCINDLSSFIFSGTETSFVYFLSILNWQLTLDKDNSLWRSLKGRIYTKFIPKKIKDMSEAGLQNCFTLFLVLIKSGQFEVVDQIYRIASIIETSIDPRKQIISWKALFVLLKLFQEKQRDEGQVIDCITKSFNSMCSNYVKVNRDSVLKNKLMNLLLVYIDNVGEIFKRVDNLNLVACNLISSGFSELLPACGISEGNYILSVIFSILKEIHNVVESNEIDCGFNETVYTKILQLMLDNIYPFIENIAITETAPVIGAEIAGFLTKLENDFSSPLSSESFDFHKIFTHFAFTETVDSKITCQYLWFILDYPIITDEMELRIPDFDVLIFRSWLKCIIYVQSDNYNVQKLTQKIVQQQVITKYITNTDSLLSFEAGDDISLSVKVFREIGKAFSNCAKQERTTFAHKMQQYFKNYASLVSNRLKKERDHSAFSHVYKLTSQLVEYCSSVLHYRTSEHVLLHILDQTVYPQLLFPKDKDLQHLVACCIKEELLHFMRGLFELDYRNDKSIERIIKDIFLNTIRTFPPSSNPLIKIVVDSVSRQPEGLCLDAYSFILDTLKDKLLSRNIEKPLTVFQFLHEIFKQVPLSCKKEITNILLICAMDRYMRKMDTEGEILKVLIKKVLMACAKRQVSSQTVILRPVVESFIEEKLPWQVVRGFNVLDFFVECVPQVISDCMAFLTKAIQTHEMKRGIGEDQLLRTGLRTIVSKLQKKLTTVSTEA